MNEKSWLTVTAAADVTPAMLEQAAELIDDALDDAGRVDREALADLIERHVDGPNGEPLDLGTSLSSPALNKFVRHARAVLREG